MMAFSTPEEILAYQNTKIELENEVQRRQKIGKIFGAIYTEMLSRLEPKFHITKQALTSILQNVSQSMEILEALV